MTLTSSDIGKIQNLYGTLASLQAQRLRIKDVTSVTQITSEARKGTSGVEYHHFKDLTPEATKEIKDIVARDIRRRAAKIVEQLHKHGCEAKLTEE